MNFINTEQTAAQLIKMPGRLEKRFARKRKVICRKIERLVRQLIVFAEVKKMLHQKDGFANATLTGDNGQATRHQRFFKTGSSEVPLQNTEKLPG